MTLDDLARLAQLIKLSGETVNDLAKVLPFTETDEIKRLGSAVQEAADQLFHIATSRDVVDTQRNRQDFRTDQAGYAITNFAGRFVGASRQFLAMVGQSREQLYNSTILEITHEQDRLKNYALLERLKTYDRNFTIRKRYRRPDASVIWVENDVLPLTDEAGQVLIMARSRPLVGSLGGEP